MTIDLEGLVGLHPDLPDEVAAAMAFAGAVALERHTHEPGVELALDLCGSARAEAMVWRARGADDAAMIDAKRATEDGAECIALGIVGHHRPRWRLERRLQSGKGEGADWLFRMGGAGELVVLEVSGTDHGTAAYRMTAKRKQASGSLVTDRAAACVVRFEDPRAVFWESEHDRSA